MTEQTNRNSELPVTPIRAYSNKKNAQRAVEKKGLAHLRHFYTWTSDGRCFPVFVGEEAAQEGAHFHFNLIA